MIKKEKFLIAEYQDIELRQQDATKIRGYFADMDKGDIFMHNHLKTGGNIYQYPQVQYKVLHKHPFIVAFGNGINSIYPKLMSTECVILGNKKYNNPDLQIRLETKTIGNCDKTFQYKFLTPWLALNQENYRKYASLKTNFEKTQMLENVLIGNILSMCKGFNVKLEHKINVLSDLENIPVKFKGKIMIGFTGKFTVNVKLPTLCGIGKGVSRGMGTIAFAGESSN